VRQISRISDRGITQIVPVYQFAVHGGLDIHPGFRQYNRESIVPSLRQGECAREQGDSSGTDLRPFRQVLPPGRIIQSFAAVWQHIFGCMQRFLPCMQWIYPTDLRSIYLSVFSSILFVFQLRSPSIKI
jgi:hypothetical protein